MCTFTSTKRNDMTQINKTREQLISEEIAAAKKVGAKHGMVAIVTESKVSEKSRKTWFGFHFEKANACEIGKTYTRQDGSIFLVIATV